MTYALSLVDLISIFAAVVVMASYMLPRRLWLCGLAITCNLVFIGYGLYLGLLPVWLLHLVVLGLQLLRFDLGGSTTQHNLTHGQGPKTRSFG